MLPGVTPASIMRMCAGLSGLQCAEIAKRLKGSRLKFSGPASVITPFTLGGVSMSMQLGVDEKPFDAYLIFPGDIEGLSLLRIDEQVIVDGQLYAIETSTIRFVDCRLLSRPDQTVARRFDVSTVCPPLVPPQRVQVRPIQATSTPDPVTEASDQARLPAAALKAWYEAFRIAYPKGSNVLAEKMARAAWPDHRIVRDRLRELMPKGQLGRPKNTDG